MIAAVESGLIQRQIEEAAFEYQQQVDTGERVIVGVNRFQAEETVSPPVFKGNKAVEGNQVRKLAEIRAKRDNQKVNKALAHLDEASRGKDNVMPFILEAVREYASLGEICNVLRGVFGVYDEKKGR